MSRVALTSLREPTMINCRVALTQGFAVVQKLTDIMDGSQGANDKRIIVRISEASEFVGAAGECDLRLSELSTVEWVGDIVSE